MKRFFVMSLISVAASFLMHGAASELQSVEEDFAFIGMAASPRGNYVLLAPPLAQSSETYDITLVYSEHERLKQQDVLVAIATNLAKHEIDRDYTKFMRLCKAETAPYSEAQYSYNFVALRLLLTVDKVKQLACCQPGGSTASGIAIWDFSRPASLLGRSYCASSSGMPIEHAQEQAKLLQTTYPEESFHLLIDLERWRSIVEPKWRVLKEEKKEKRATAKARACVQQ